MDDVDAEQNEVVANFSMITGADATTAVNFLRVAPPSVHASFPRRATV
jgi:hypothetical protein